MFDFFAIIGLTFVILILAVLFLLPSGKASSRRAKRDRLSGPEDNKDWKSACLKLEKYIHGLRGEIEQGKMRERKLERDFLIQREKNKKLQEKMTQERGWQDKEEVDKGKKMQELIQVKEALTRTEHELQQEHGERLRLEREIKETKEAMAAVAEAKRQVETQIARFTAQLDTAKTELTELRQQNAKLSKQHDDATWVAKSEYVKVQEQLRALEKEFILFKSQVRRENL